MTREELAREVLELPRLPVVLLPDTQVTERPDWLSILTPSLKQGGLNEVSKVVVSEAEVEAAITRTLERYARAGSRFRWSVLPDSRPLDLADRLAARGMVRSETRAMYRDTSPLAEGPGAIEVRQVAPDEVQRFTEVLGRGWGMNPAPLLPLHTAMVADARCALFLAFLEGEPVGTAGLVRFERSAYLLGGVVLPEARKRGVYRALVGHRLNVARAAGLGLMSVHARADTSGPLLERLGFVELLSYPTFTLAR